MKGMVFVELLAMAEGLLGEESVDEVLNTCPLSSGGAYTTVGNYPCGELMAIVQAFSDRSGAPVAQLQRNFGHWMHQRFVEGYPSFFAERADALSMLEAIEDEVHVEVRKLYPDVELPSFESQRLDDGQTLRLTYRSPRPLSDFCHGLVEACVVYFGRPAEIQRRELQSENGMATEFTIRMTA